MGLKEIIDRIESDAEAKARKALDDAKEESEKITKDAESEASKRVAEAKARAESQSKMIIAREGSKANVEASQMYHERLNGEVNAAIGSIGDFLQEYAKGQEYGKLLQKLADRAAGELGEDCTVSVRPNDIKLIKPGRYAVVASSEQFVGGLKASSKDGAMFVDYTLEKILSMVKDRVAVEILKLVK